MVEQYHLKKYYNQKSLKILKFKVLLLETLIALMRKLFNSLKRNKVLYIEIRIKINVTFKRHLSINTYTIYKNQTILFLIKNNIDLITTCKIISKQLNII